MRLLRPNPGEIADRQTILELKIKYGGGKQEPTITSDEITEVGVDGSKRMNSRTILKDPSPINIQPFIDENETLQLYLEKAWFPDISAESGKQYDQLYEELAELNHQVWKLTDQAHTLREAPDRMQAAALERAAEVLFAITDLNDKRAEIVKKINALFAVSVQEKIFS